MKIALPRHASALSPHDPRDGATLSVQVIMNEKQEYPDLGKKSGEDHPGIAFVSDHLEVLVVVSVVIPSDMVLRVLLVSQPHRATR